MPANYPIESMTENLVDAWHSTPAETRALGEEWYFTAHHYAQNLARVHHTTLSVAAGVVAALSPRQIWHKNLEYADQWLGAVGERIDGIFGRSLTHAWRICEGERPLDVMRGPKTRARR